MEMHIPAAVREARQSAVITTPLRHEAAFHFSSQFGARFDPASRIMWLRWNAEPRPCFNPSLLAAISVGQDFLEQTGGVIYCGGGEHPIEYVAVTSANAGVFNLGGDLDLFRQLIETHDRAGLLRYGRACIDVLYRNYKAYELPLTTISLVQGECLGGGFEAALCSDVIIAEKSSRFGFPEILFNLFPGMGAYSFLDRKIGQRGAEEVIASGKVYSAEEMKALGVVDVVAEDGQGEAELLAFVKRRSRSRNGLQGLAATRRRVHGIEFQELLDVVEIWADTALRINSRDLKLMQRLVTRQNGAQEPQNVH